MPHPTYFLLTPVHNNFSDWKTHLLSCYPNNKIHILSFQEYQKNSEFYHHHMEQLFCITDTEEILPLLPKISKTFKNLSANSSEPFFCKFSNSFPCAIPIAGILPSNTLSFHNELANNISSNNIFSNSLNYNNLPLDNISFHNFFLENSAKVSSTSLWNLQKLPYLFEGINTLDAKAIHLVYSRFYQLPVTILETKRLALREWSLKDLPVLKKLYNHASFNPSILCPWDSEENAEQWLNSYISAAYNFFNYGLWCIEKKDTKEIIGQFGIEYKERNNRDYHELQYMLFPQFQNNGYAFEIGQAVCFYAKKELELSELSLFILPENKSSLRLAKKLNFQYVEKLKINDLFFCYFSQSL